MEKKTKKLLINHLKEYHKYMEATKKSPNFQRMARTRAVYEQTLNKKIKELDFLIITVKELD